MSRHVEREDKFDITGPIDLARVVDRAAARIGSAQHASYELDNLYFDTAGADLLRHGVTLRRRTGGGPDDGWHLKLPAGRARTEIRTQIQAGDPAGDHAGEDIPAELAARVGGLTRGRPLRPIARILEHRETHLLLGPDDEAVAEIDDDTVEATLMPPSSDPGPAARWREVEVELRDGGDEAILSWLGNQLAKAGARPSPYGAKLQRALAHSALGADLAAPGADEAADPLTGYLRAQALQLVAGDLALRDAEISVHDTRVASRRLRSALRTFTPILEPGRTAHLQQELGWYAQILGDVRENEVLSRRLSDEIAALPDELVLGPVRRRVSLELRTQRRRAQAALRRALDSPRYFELLDEVEAFAAQPPLAHPARSALLKRRARSARRKAVRRLRLGLERGDDASLHAARKAAKRARYAAELMDAGGRGGHRRRRDAARFADLQEILGEHQDAAVAAYVVRQLGAAAAGRADENGFTFGLLHERQRAAARRSTKRATKWLASELTRS